VGLRYHLHLMKHILLDAIHNPFRDSVLLIEDGRVVGVERTTRKGIVTRYFRK